MNWLLPVYQALTSPRPSPEPEEVRAERIARLHAAGKRGTKEYFREAKRQSRERMRKAA